jgi:hypothetical protein
MLPSLALKLFRRLNTSPRPKITSLLKLVQLPLKEILLEENTWIHSQARYVGPNTHKLEDHEIQMETLWVRIHLLAIIK